MTATLLLLELLRHDARPPAPGSLVKLFEPVVRDHPGDLHSALALGLALTRAGQVEKGIDELRRVVKTHPDRVEAWDCLLTGLDESGQVDVMEEELERLPAGIAESPRLLKHRARIAQGSRWKEAVELYRQAQRPSPTTASSSTGSAGPCGTSARRPRPTASRSDSAAETSPSRSSGPSTTRPPRPATSASARTSELYQKIAETRERMQLPDEARAWHRLVLLDEPGNEVSLAALARLGTEGGRRHDAGG